VGYFSEGASTQRKESEATGPQDRKTITTNLYNDAFFTTFVAI
jgi:hypothetical protein